MKKIYTLMLVMVSFTIASCDFKKDDTKDAGNKNDKKVLNDYLKKDSLYFVEDEQFKTIPVLIKGGDRYLTQPARSLSIEVKYNPELTKYGYKSTDVITSTLAPQELEKNCKEHDNKEKTRILPDKTILCEDHKGRGVLLFPIFYFTLNDTLLRAIPDKTIELYATVELENGVRILPEESKQLTKLKVNKTTHKGKLQIISVAPIPDSKYYKIDSIHRSYYMFVYK